MKQSYTAHGNPKIDETIERHMEIVTDEVRRAASNVDSIVLAGGFGRGEGSVRRLPEGGYLPINDYDLFVFTDTPVSFDTYQKLTKHLKDRIGVEIDMKFLRTRSLRSLVPDMFTFELKSASRVIWGKDLRDQILHEKKDVPLSAGLNTLFLEMLALITNFEPEYLSGKIPRDKVPILNYVCSKAFIEICNALSLLGNFYDPYCSRRCDLFAKYYDAFFPELSKVLPDLPSKVRHHTYLKLRSLNFCSGDPINRWFDARSALKYTLWYFASKVLHQPFNTRRGFLEFLSTNRRKLASFYFEPYLNYAFRRTRMPTVPFLLKIAMPAVHVFENLRYIINSYRSIRRVYLGPLFRLESPLMKIYTSSVLLLHSIEEGGTVDMTLVREAHRSISSMYPYGAPDDKPWKRWRDVRDGCSLSFKTFASTPRTITF